MALPLPNVISNVGPGGPLVTAMGGMNAYNNALQDTKIKAAQAQYAPEQSYANAFLTNQQAQWLPYQYKMQAMSNPLLWMAAEKNPQLMEQLQKMMSNPMEGNGTGGMQIQPPSRSNSFVDMLMNKLGLSGSGQQGQQGFPGQPQSQGNPMMQNPRTSGSQPTNSLVAPPTQGTSSPSIGYSTPAGSAASVVAGRGGLGPENPYAASQAAQEAAKTAVVGQASNQNTQQSKRSEILSSQSQIATQALKSLEAFDRNYDKSSYKGQYFTPERAENIPTLPGSTVAPEQLTNRYANQYLTDLSALGDTPAGKTDEGRSLIASGKVDISLDKEAKKELVDSSKAKLHRMITMRDFANDFYAKNPGATDEQLVGMMNAYNRYAPSYDYEKGKQLPENDKKFKDFTSPKALASYRYNGDYNPYAAKREEKEENTTHNPEENKVHKRKHKQPVYAQSVAEWNSGKQPSDTIIEGGEKFYKLGSEWHYASLLNGKK